MKRFFLVITFALIALYATAENHFTFNGIEINGSQEDVVNKLKESLDINSSWGDYFKAKLEGSYLGGEARFIVHNTPLTRKVYAIEVLYPASNEWSKLLDEYRGISKLIINKESYGELLNVKYDAMVLLPYYKGNEIEALHNNKLSYFNRYDYENGYRTISITSETITEMIFSVNMHYIRIVYVDNKNSKINEEEKEITKNHLTFYGIEINGKLRSIYDKLKEKGFRTITNREEATADDWILGRITQVNFSGNYLGFPIEGKVHCGRFKEYDDVYEISITTPAGNSWSAVKNTYDQIIHSISSVYKGKYTSIRYNEQIGELYKQGDEFTALKEGKIYYWYIWTFSNGSIYAVIDYVGSRAVISLRFIDNLNSKKYFYYADRKQTLTDEPSHQVTQTSSEKHDTKQKLTGGHFTFDGVEIDRNIGKNLETKGYSDEDIDFVIDGGIEVVEEWYSGIYLGFPVDVLIYSSYSFDAYRVRLEYSAGNSWNTIFSKYCDIAQGINDGEWGKAIAISKDEKVKEPYTKGNELAALKAGKLSYWQKWEYNNGTIKLSIEYNQYANEGYILVELTDKQNYKKLFGK